MEQLYQLLKEHNLTVSTAESCTGGMISSRITDVSGISDYFNMGVVTYSNDAKMKLINVSQQTLDEYGAVSAQTAMEMADGIRILSGADIGISSTGIAGPTGGTAKKPVGLVYIGVSGKFGTEVFENIFKGQRKDVREKTVSSAIGYVKEYIQKFYG